MKKSLIALAVLGTFAGAASAQSSVTVYGRLNLGVVKEQGQSARIDQFGNGANRLGFRGVEDLGGGLKGTFDIQHRFAPESGGNDGNANGRPFWQGVAKVGLAGGFGSVELGRMLTAYQAPINATDPWATETVGALNYLANGYTTDPRQADGAGAGRTDVITYNSPNFAGFSGSFSFGPERSAGSNGLGNGVAATANAKDLYSLWLSYSAGPLMVGAGAEQNRRDDTIASVLASFNMGFATVMGGYSRVDNAAGGATNKRNNYNVAAVVPLGSFNLKAGFASTEDDVTGNKNDKIGVGAEYVLSKRTYLYTTYGRQDNSFTAAGFSSLGNVDNFDIGVSHSF